MATDALDALAGALGPLARRDQPLGARTTYRVGGTAALGVEARGEEDLLAVRRALADHRVPVVVVGRGSNLLVADAGFPGLAVTLAGRFEDLDLPGPDAPAVVRAGAAVGLPVLARRSVEAGLTGLEWAVGVPGSVGGAVRMNAGGHGSDLAASLLRCRWVDLGDAGGLGEGESGVAAPGALGLGYRTSAVRDTCVVCWADLAVGRGDPAAGRRTIADIVRWRREHQPGGSNAGSVFTNPPGDSAGRLVEAAGLKGRRLGTAAVSTKHANFIQADDGGSADDVWRLIRLVRTGVAERLGVTLHPEVRLLGFPPFDDESPGAPEDRR
ncbi:MAG TPA: UDP-N-acetylmuramate dehydrogenase [Acidimicrobiales bacterium]|nr:UDP-N-acetylmuramate dehydrogenase [Acidimicrobiales bacterium]